MIQSMTGYGKEIIQLPSKTITIEIKSLNSKGFDIYSRIPPAYREKELELRDLLAKSLVRGKVDFSIYIIDVAQGEKIPRKAGQGMIKSDLFIINKVDLAPYVGANLDVMKHDKLTIRRETSFKVTNLKNDEGVNKVLEWIKKNCLLEGIK